MGNTGFHELRAFSRKAKLRVKTHRTRLGVEQQGLMFFVCRLFKQPFHQRTAHIFATPVGGYRHAADMAVG